MGDAEAIATRCSMAGYPPGHVRCIFRGVEDHQSKDKWVSGMNWTALVATALAAGLAMWTKNEGLLFTLSVATGILVAGRVAGWPATRRRLGAFVRTKE